MKLRERKVIKKVPFGRVADKGPDGTGPYHYTKGYRGVKVELPKTFPDNEAGRLLNLFLNKKGPLK